MTQRKTTTSLEALPPLDDLLTVEQVAERLGLSKPTIYELIYHEGLPSVKLGKSRRIIPASLQQWLKEREQ
ncbi:MAG: helix-turn-helix domain-containing protein [Ktedonobacteraceae bacterium]|nr:helix-turn-helix domain-containing protein [Ktedonobacteraceae bacterium]MBO0795194.1 helix-turn-helix domain-containing protein [Ktedonobacteraceae bacterium]